MFSFLAIQNPDGSPPGEWDARVARVAARAFPWTNDLRCTRWASPSGTSLLWTWSNEPSSVTGGVETTHDSARVWLGCGGRGPSCVITSNRIACTTTIARLEPIYYAEQAGKFFVASRALLIALLLSKTGRLSFDFVALSASFANAYASGGFTTNRTPFAGITMAMPNSSIIAQDRKIYVTDPGNVFSDFGFGTDEPGQHFYRELTKLFLERVDPYVRSTKDLEFSVTGGQDSRLLAAALKALGVTFTARTTGLDNNPDVIIGKRVAAFLGVPHKQDKLNTYKSELGDLFELDARWEAARDLLHSDGMYLFEPYMPKKAVRLPSNVRFEPHPVLDTAGSEIWRGGYASRRFAWFNPSLSEQEITISAVQSIVTDIFCRYAYFLQPEWRREYETYAANWLAPCINRGKPIAAAERFYLEFEFGRRTPAINTRASATSASFFPFADPEILGRIARLKTRFRRDDLLHYNVMKMLAPGLENLPFEIKRWGFEWSAPANEADRGAWLARAPLIDPRSVTTEAYGEVYGAWPMRGAVGSDCWRRLRDELFCYEEGQNVWSFIDRESLLKAFTSDEIFTSEMSNLFWVIYGLSVLLAGDWLVTSDIPVSLLYTRSELPWPQLYKDLCAGAAEAETTAQHRLTNEIADWLGRVDDDDKSPPEPVEPRVLMSMEEHPFRDKRARFAPGEGRQLHLDILLEENSRSWRARVDAERSSPPTTSYLILPLGKVADARHADIVVNLRYRAKSPSIAWCYLARYTSERRTDLAGPLLKYEPEWKAVEHVFSNLGKGLEGEGALKMEFLLGLPDGANEAEIDGLEIGLRPHEAQQPLSIFMRRIERQLIGDLRCTIGAIQKRYGLSELKTEDLMCRAGLNGNRLDPTSEYELWRFENWLRETCPQNLAPNDLAKRLTAGRAHWRLLTLCFGLSEDIRRHLLETAITSVPPLQGASVAT